MIILPSGGKQIMQNNYSYNEFVDIAKAINAGELERATQLLKGVNQRGKNSLVKPHISLTTGKTKYQRYKVSRKGRRTLSSQ